MAKVLLIDDDADIRRLLRKFLEAGNHEILEAADGASGIAQADSHQVDLVITDVVMPGLDGLDVIQAIRTKAKAPRILTISAGAAAFPAAYSLRLSEAFGADATLYKPFRRKDFLEAVDRLLSTRRP